MTTYYFIRHAEKEWDNTSDPSLTPQGERRAQHWAEILKDKGIEKIYCTSLRRTQETAQPLLDKLGLTYEIYNPNNFYFEKFKKETEGKTVLVVGHQDVTPQLVNLFVGKYKYPYIKSADFSNLYKVKITDEGELVDTLQRMDF